MKRRTLLKGIGTASLIAVSGNVVAAGVGDDDRTIVEHPDGPGEYFVVTDDPSGGVAPESHGGGYCFIRCCSGDCPCASGCHCLEPDC